MLRSWLICLLLGSLISSAHPARAEDSEQFDILMIAVDDLRPWLGCYGEDWIHSPAIDRLAARSVRFERAYCQYAKCGLSRLSIMTGLRPDSIGVTSHRASDVESFRKRFPQAVTLPTWFRMHGYQTHGFGKIDHDGWTQEADWSTSFEAGREREMWEIVDPDDPDGPTVIADRDACPAIQKIKGSDKKLFAGRITNLAIERMAETDDSPEPRFLAIGYRRPHLPFVAPNKYFELYHQTAIEAPLPILPSRDTPVAAFFNSDSYSGLIRKQGGEYPEAIDHETATSLAGYELRSYSGMPRKGPFSEETRNDLMRAYAACISYVDAQIGRLLKALAESPRAERTIIVLWSDHGWHLGEHGTWSKMTNFEVATRVPFLIALPRNGTGSSSDHLVELVDLYPTLCDLAGIPAPDHLQGDSLTSILENPSLPQIGYARSDFVRRLKPQQIGRALRTSRFRFVEWYLNDDSTAATELYDHRSDPHETNNLAADPAFSDALQSLRDLLNQDLKKYGARPGVLGPAKK